MASEKTLTSHRLDSLEKSLTTMHAEMVDTLNGIDIKLDAIIRIETTQLNHGTAIERAFGRIDLINRVLDGHDGVPGLVGDLQVVKERTNNHGRALWGLLFLFLSTAAGWLLWKLQQS